MLYRCGERRGDQCDPLQLSVTRYKKEIRDINASGEVLLSDAKLEAEAEAHVQADIAEQVDIVKQVSHPLHVLDDWVERRSYNVHLQFRGGKSQLWIVRASSCLGVQSLELSRDQGLSVSCMCSACSGSLTRRYQCRLRSWSPRQSCA